MKYVLIIGDGIADDTDAFKMAIATVGEMGGGTVFAPKGKYKITSSLTLPPLVTLAGELKKGSADGTVLCICHGKGERNRECSAILCGAHSSVQGIAFWYPEQSLDGGAPIPYPPTIAQTFIDGFTLRNVTLVNSFVGIDAKLDGVVYALQYIRDVYGTCLECGFYNDFNLDIGKLEGFSLSPNIWLDR